MNKISLNGTWTARGVKHKNIQAEVPGCIHTDLMASGIIDDPYYRDNEARQMWVGETDWTYERDFHIDKDLLEETSVKLVCLGLDTISKITINNKEIGKTDNMFRSWEFDIKDVLKIGSNHISIHFYSALKYAKKQNDERWLWTSGLDFERMEGSNRLRKMHSNFGWDWGPKCVTCGIWRDIEIKAYSEPKIEDLHVVQTHLENKVALGINISLKDYDGSFHKARVQIGFEGKEISSMSVNVSTEKTFVEMEIANPKLWWPSNMGKQNLYDVEVLLFDEKGQKTDTKKTRIGLRTLILERKKDEWGESFRFKVNGVSFFAKGANWIPIDTFVTRGSDEFYRQLLSDAKQANMNFIRVWGGGIYEPEIFYEICDELGLCVWQDFMFACSAYPAYDENFMHNVKHEVIENIVRLRNHPCIALFCGNNEIEHDHKGAINETGKAGAMTWAEYEALFDELIKQAVEKHAPDICYWPSSSHTPGGNRLEPNDATKGDAHLWQVWHGRQPFEWYRTCKHRFISEFGFQSFPEPKVVNSFTLPEDRNVSSYIMEHHQRSLIGNDAIMQYMLSWFKLPNDFDMLMWLSQILQGMAIKYAIEHWRRNMPQTMGAIYWQLNDCWPAASWSSIDYLGNWKALHYMTKRFFSPILISILEDTKSKKCEIHLTNDRLTKIEGVAKWSLYTLQGDCVCKGHIKCEMGKNATGLIGELDFAEESSKYGKRNLILFVSYIEKGKIISQNTAYFVRPKHLMLEAPEIKISVTKVKECEFVVQLSSNRPALWVWAEVKDIVCRFSDNFFDMIPNLQKEILIETSIDLDVDSINKALKINCLTDTY